VCTEREFETVKAVTPKLSLPHWLTACWCPQHVSKDGCTSFSLPPVCARCKYLSCTSQLGQSVHLSLDLFSGLPPLFFSHSPKITWFSSLPSLILHVVKEVAKTTPQRFQDTKSKCVNSRDAYISAVS